ncbi:MAG: 4-alpha-glucanotransferase [Thermodesulfobacteriota bacterium]
MALHRSCGILAHLTSLPGPFGIGDLDSACHFLVFLEASEQSFWQFLPTGIGCEAFGQSPYMTLSSFAGSPLLISPEWLVEKGLLLREELSDQPVFSEYTVHFRTVADYKGRLLTRAYERFAAHDLLHDDFGRFLREQSDWLDDYALFMALRNHHDERPWYLWPKDLARRVPKSLAAARLEHVDAIRFHQFVQFVFFSQWRRLRQAARKKRITLIGDIPIYVGADSADVWANQDCFDLDRQTLQPTHVAGVPPDYFSETGQRWGNPLYLWEKEGEANPVLLHWWSRRFAHIASMVDLVRIDHFRGFASYWRIPADEETAINGEWVRGPGLAFFRAMEKATRDLGIIAEDLGVITPDVEELRDTLGFPGMKVLQFAFDSDQNNSYLPHTYTTTNCVVYTGTHDNDTTIGWYFDPMVSSAAKDRARRYANSDGQVIHRDFIRLAYSSVAALALIPLQDVLGFGSDCRMNRPSVADGNWLWRCAPRFLTSDVARYLADEALFYGRQRVADKEESDDQRARF